MTHTQQSFLYAVLALLLSGSAFLPAAGPQPTSAPIKSAPSRPLPVITVETSCPGSDAQVVADTVAGPIEEQINGVENMRSMVSQCTNDGTYTLHVAFEPGMDLNMAQVLVQNRVALAQPILPEVVKRAGVTVKKKPLGVLMIAALYSPDGRYDALYLRNYASIQIKDELARLPGVGEVALFGGQDYGMCIRLDPEKMAACNLMASDAVRAIKEQNTLNRLVEPEQFADIILKTNPGGGIVRLKDVARIELGGNSRRSQALFDGRPVVALGISLLPDARPQQVSAAVRNSLSELYKRFPEGLDLNVAFDFTLSLEAKDRPTAPDYLLAEPDLPVNATTEDTLRLLDRCEETLLKSPGVEHVLALSENPFAPFREGTCILALLGPSARKQADRDQLVRTLRARLEQAEEGESVRVCDLSGPGRLSLGDYPIQLALSGPEQEQVRDLAAQVVARLAQSDKLTDVGIRPAAVAEPQVVVDVDRTAAKLRGVSLDDVAKILQVYLGSLHVSDFNRFGRTWSVQVQVEDQGRDLGEGVKRLKVRNAAGQMVPLSSFVTMHEVSGASRLNRLDLQPMVEITANPAPGVSLGEARGVCEALIEEVRKEDLPADYRLAWLQELPESKPVSAEQAPPTPPPPPLELPVSQPVSREVTDYVDFTGRTEAVSSVEIRARVAGYLENVFFKEGAEVKQGDVLFQIDPRPYQAVLNRAEAEVALDEAQLKYAEAVYKRNAKLATSQAVSQEEVDQSRAQVDSAAAQVNLSKASTDQAKLNLEFTKLQAPLDGLIGRRLVDPGNLVKADETVLATVVSLDPIYVDFDMDEATLLRIRAAMNAGKIKQPQGADSPVFMELQNEDGYPHQGTINFVNNQVDPSTGTISVRGVFPNAKPGNGVRLMSPGMFARVRLPIGQPHAALLVIDRTVLTDQGLKYVYVVDADNKVQYRRVTVGALQEDGLRVIEQGLAPGDHVLISGQKRVRPGIAVNPEMVPMPVLAPAPAEKPLSPDEKQR